MTAAEPEILVVDDDASIRDAICEYLARNGFAVRQAANGREMDAALAMRSADLIVLDLMMPGEDGLSIARRLAGKVPILMLSAMGDTADRVLGLEMGADDYLPKPFDRRELLARIRSLLRRPPVTDVPASLRIFRFAGWAYDDQAQLLTDPDRCEVQLTPGEQALMVAFLASPRRVLTRDHLLSLTKGPLAESFDRAIDLSISRLRRKLQRPGEPELIETVRGSGYRFSPEVRSQ